MKNYLRNNFFLFVLITIIVIEVTNNISLFSKNNIAGLRSDVKETLVSATIGGKRFTLFGYSSPNALVTISGIGVFDQTYAAETGYFEFNTFSFFSNNELCLTAQDQFGRLTLPVCLPSFSSNSVIGPVILPPTVSFDKNDYWVGNQVILTGQTLPNTEVNLSMFADEKNTILGFKKPNLSIIKPVGAFTLPKVEIRSDDKGNFSIALPSSSPKKFRLFAQVLYQDHFSPESVKLTLKILPWWMIIFKLFYFLWTLIKPHFLNIIILGQIIFLIVYLLKKIFHPVNLAIMRREEMTLMLKNEARIEKYTRFNKNLVGLFEEESYHQL